MGIIKSFLRQQAGNLIAKAFRYLGTAVGAWVTSHHYLSNSDLVNELVGGIIAVGPWLWSAYLDYVDHRDGYPAQPPAVSNPPGPVPDGGASAGSASSPATGVGPVGMGNTSIGKGAAPNP